MQDTTKTHEKLNTLSQNKWAFALNSNSALEN